MQSSDVFKYVGATGFLFTTGEKVALETALPLLSVQSKRPHLRIWGKLFGVNNDYIVVQAFADNMVEEPEIYYSVDEGLHFTLLGTASSLLASVSHAPAALPGAAPGAAAPTPALVLEGLSLQEVKQQLLTATRGPFMGDPAYEYRLSEGAADADDDLAAGGPPLLNSIKESVRLALFVEEFDYQCRVAPRGAYQLCERRAGLPAEVRVNKAFTGLSTATANHLENTDKGTTGGEDSAFTLKNYYHIREANPYRRLLDEYKTGHIIEKSMLQRYAEDRQLDATFDALSDDVPSGLWNMTYDPVRKVVLGKNKRFEGSLFFHVPESSVFGTVYMGEGTLNPNVGFEI